MFYNIHIVTRDDPRNMILKYKKNEIKFMEDYKEIRRLRLYKMEYGNYKYMDDLNFIIMWGNLIEDNKVFSIDIGIYCGYKKNILKQLDITNIETDSIIKEIEKY